MIKRVTMTEDEARDYISLVHAKVDKNGGCVSMRGKVAMPEYDHAKYVEAMSITSIHGTDVPEPFSNFIHTGPCGTGTYKFLKE